MRPSIKFRTAQHQAGALKDAPKILSRHLRGGLEVVGKRLQASARARMRKDVGREQDSLKVYVTGSGLNLNLRVVSTLVQAFVDAYGMKRGVFPEFRIDSPLYVWARRRLKGIPTKQIKTIGTPQGPHHRRKLQSVTRIHNVRPAGFIPTEKRARAKMSNARRLAFLVARAIFRRGRMASSWNQKALQANRTRIIREMSNAISRAANEMKRKV